MANFLDTRISEKRFYAIPTQAFTSDGGSDGSVEVVNTYCFKVGQIVTIASNVQAPSRFKVKAVLSDRILKVGPIDAPIYKFSDMTAYTTADTAMIELVDDSINNSSSASNKRPVINLDEIRRQVYEEEPTIALRTHNVDWLGRSYSASNPVPVAFTGDVNVSINEVTTPKITHIPVPSANTEVNYTLTTLTKRFRLRVQDDDSKLQLAFAVTESATNYWTVNRGSYYEDNNIDASGGITLYFQCNKANQTVHIQYWEE